MGHPMLVLGEGGKGRGRAGEGYDGGVCVRVWGGGWGVGRGAMR